MIKRKTLSISIVAPARNEEKNIEKFVTITSKTLNKLTHDWEIIITNDNSTDKTGEIVDFIVSKNKKIKVLTNVRRLGVTQSLWKAISVSRKDYIVFLPVDLESNPKEDIPSLIKELQSGSDFVLGWRQNKKVGIIKSLTTKVLYILSRLLFHVSFHDMSWIKAFRREVIKDFPSLRSDWQKFFAIIAYYKGFRVSEIKTNWYPRNSGKSNFGRFGLGRIPTSFFDLFELWFILNFSKKPLHIFGSIGIFVFMTGFLIGLYILYADYIQMVNIKTRIPLIILSSLLIMTGVQLLAIGFLAELFVNTQDSFRQNKNL